MTKTKYITLTLEEFDKLKETYALAKKEGKKQFKFKGRILITDFAKYYIQYIGSVLERDKQRTYDMLRDAGAIYGTTRHFN